MQSQTGSNRSDRGQIHKTPAPRVAARNPHHVVRPVPIIDDLVKEVHYDVQQMQRWCSDEHLNQMKERHLQYVIAADEPLVSTS